MQCRFKKEANHSWLIIEEEKNLDPDLYSVKMICGGIVPGLLKCHVQNIDGRGSMFYEVTALQTLRSTYEHRKLTASDIRLILEECIQAAENVEDYLLSPDMLLLDPDTVFLNPERNKLFFCCYPGQNREFRDMLSELAEYLLPAIDHNDREAMAAGYGFYRRISDPSVPVDQLRKAVYASDSRLFEGPAEDSRESASRSSDQKPPDGREALWDEAFVREGYTVENGGKIRKEKRTFSAVLLLAAAVVLCLTALFFQKEAGIRAVPLEILIPGFTAAVCAGVLASVIWKKALKRPAKKENNVCAGLEEGSGWDHSREPDSSESFTDLSLFGGYSDQSGEYTEAVSKSAGREKEIPALLPESPCFPVILLKNGMTVVGSLPGAVDVVLKSPAVSRVHARIMKKDGVISIRDLHSRNGTFLNGLPLGEEEEHALKKGEELSFADVGYTLGSKTEIVF